MKLIIDYRLYWLNSFESSLLPTTFIKIKGGS